MPWLGGCTGTIAWHHLAPSWTPLPVLQDGWLYSVCMILRVRWLLEVPYMVAALVCSAWLDSGYMFLRCGIHTCSTCKLTWVLRFSRHALPASRIWQSVCGRFLGLSRMENCAQLLLQSFCSYCLHLERDILSTVDEWYLSEFTQKREVCTVSDPMLHYPHCTHLETGPYFHEPLVHSSHLHAAWLLPASSV